MYIPRTPLRRYAPLITVAVAAVVGTGAIGVTQLSAGGHAVAAVPTAVSPTDNPTVAPSAEDTPAPSLPMVFTPAVNTGWDVPDPNDPSLAALESYAPRPRVTVTHRPTSKPTSTPTPKPTHTATPDPTPPSTPPTPPSTPPTPPSTPPTPPTAPPHG
jgi:hypothetical protein